MASEQSLSGLLDFRLTSTDSSDSYLRGGYGKFSNSDGENLSLGQLALNYRVEWENNISFHIITNGFSDNENDGFGISESYLKYRGLPTESGYRYQLKAGFMYPHISMENTATGWSTPHTLTSSTLNTWIGEEVKHLGLEGSISRLGKFSDSPHDFKLTLALFTHNDTNGSVLSWHGWTQSSRQSYWSEELKFPPVPALEPGQMLANQAAHSEPFLELDSRVGYHLNGQWNWRGNGQVLIGYYDNRGGTDIVERGQYAWITRFSHFGVKWKLAKDLTLTAQFMAGDTRMRVVNNFDVVAVDFSNLFVMLSQKWNVHRLTARVEKFDVEDFDHIALDNNDEDGEAVTLSYGYQWNKQMFTFLEYNWIDSNRFSRSYLNLDTTTVERQYQLGLRYYF